jgi:hypothetical protein
LTHKLSEPIAHFPARKGEQIQSGKVQQQKAYCLTAPSPEAGRQAKHLECGLTFAFPYQLYLSEAGK